MLQLQNISLSFGPRLVIPHLHQSIQKGQITVISGKNGSGKSSLIRMILGKQRASTGQVLLDGMDVYALNRHQQKTYFESSGIVMQDIIPHEGTNIIGFLTSQTQAEKGSIEHMLNWLQLTGREGEPLKQLSTSERRRLDLGRTLLKRHQMIIWDDPFAYLDDYWTEKFLDRLKRENQELGTTIVMSCGDHEQVEFLYPEVMIRL